MAEVTGKGRVTGLFHLQRPLVMGVVNITPDSFSDGGRFFDAKKAIGHARRLAEEGADIIDIGGESTRPGAPPVPVQEELDRVIPVLEEVRDLCVSVDTRRPEVMKAALAAGASMINDIEALQAPGAIEAVRNSHCAVCLMHMQGQPATMQQEPHYDDVVAEVGEFLRRRIAAAEAGGIARNRLVADPGFGFGKTAAHNLTLLKNLGQLELGVPLLVGLSRKSTIGRITGRPADARLAGSLAMALIALQRGATILRVHDVKDTRDVVAVWEAVRTA
ncbi:MAG TPA: dihydropteroate synthase [Burkholderiales bacterium]|nr:dihydropteroate synthase [Burkholderiales bacterium]